MASSLFNRASAAARDIARRNFQRSALGRLTRDIDRAARRGGLSPSEVRQYSRRLEQITGPQVAGDILRSMLGPDVMRYARESGVGGAFDEFFKALGPVGRLIKSMIRPGSRSGGKVSLGRELAAAAGLLRKFGWAIIPRKGITRKQQEEMAELLRGMGWTVEEPKEPAPPGSPQAAAESTSGRGSTGGTVTGMTPSGAKITKPASTAGPRRSIDVDLGGSKVKNPFPKTGPLYTGEMVPVVSSNVHSIGFRLDANDSVADLQVSKGTLLIRFLGTGQKGKRTGPGPLYEYFDVPARLFMEFLRAASKGKFVWDNVRVRGSVSGHKFSYDLALLEPGTGYVPRQAGLKRGEHGEWFLRRRWKDAAGNVFTSRLPERQVRLSGPNRGPAPAGGINSLKIVPNRGRPNRGEPFRGR